MITLSTGQLEAWLAQLFWPFIRIGACLMVAPTFAAAPVPARVRIVLAGAIALIVAPLVPTPAQITPFSAAGMVITVQQVLIGVALGFCLQIIFDAVTMGGQLLASSMGLSFAQSIDPLRGASTPVVGQLYNILLMLMFLALNGHLRLIDVLVDGFRTLPVGASGLGAEGIWRLIGWGTQIFAGAVAVALPGVTALLIVNLAFGIVSRAAPTLNLFAVGFPVSLVLGLAIVFAGLPALEASCTRLLENAFLTLQALSGG